MSTTPFLTLDPLLETVMDEWHTIETAPPDEIVETKLDDEHGERNVGPLIRQGRLWFTPDKAMYVYYTPTHWRRQPKPRG